jgi:hypothetical protein
MRFRALLVLVTVLSACSGGNNHDNSSTSDVCTSLTYTDWTPSVCPANGQQTRTVASASPNGCTGGNPVLTQTCTPGAPTCTSFTYSDWTPSVCPAVGEQTRAVVSSLPSGCTGGTSVLTQTCTPAAPACTSFTYSDWTPSVCPSNGQQTRTVVSASPSGCAGGAPVLTQTCTPAAPACTSFTYSDWTPSVCPSNGQQTRTVVSALPSGCSGGSPVLVQTCTPAPTTASLVFVNNTTYFVSELGLVPTGTVGYGSAINSSPIPPGGSYTITNIPPGTYKAAAVIPISGVPYYTYWNSISLNAGDADQITGNPGGYTGAMQVNNTNSLWNLIDVRVSPTGLATWGSNVLTGPIVPGGSELVYNMVPGTWDLRCALADGSVSYGYAWIISPLSTLVINCY